MGHTRKDTWKEPKLSESELLALIARCDAQGIPMYAQTAIACSSRKLVCSLHGMGKITYQQSDYGRALNVGDLVHIA